MRHIHGTLSALPEPKQPDVHGKEVAAALSWKLTGSQADAQVECKALGGMVGSLAVWGDGTLTGFLRTETTVPVERREEVKKLFDQENSKIAWANWDFSRKHHVVLRITGARCNSDLRTGLPRQLHNLLRRMDEQANGAVRTNR